VLTNDPGMGVIRQADAGYDLADEVAADKGVPHPHARDGMTSLESRFAALWGSLAPVGGPTRAATCATRGPGPDLECRDWFTEGRSTAT